MPTKTTVAVKTKKQPQRKLKKKGTVTTVTKVVQPKQRSRQGIPPKLSPAGVEYFNCAIRSFGGPAQIPDGSATPSLSVKHQYCHVITPDSLGRIAFAITPNIVGNFAILYGKVAAFPVYNLVTSAWERVTFDSDTIPTDRDFPYVTATFPDLRAGNPLNGGQNDAYYRVQSWRTVDSCAKVTYRGAPLYASGTVQVVRQSVVQERISNAVSGSHGAGLLGNYADQLAGVATIPSASPYDADYLAIAGAPITSSSVVAPGLEISSLRIELSSFGPSSMSEMCSLVGAESYPAHTTLHSKVALQDTMYQPYIEGASAVVNTQIGAASNQYQQCWGQLVHAVQTTGVTVSNADYYTAGTLPGYGHGDTTFFLYEGLTTAVGELASIFVESEACFEVTLNNRSSVGRLARMAPSKDPLALDVVSDIQKKMPAASTSGNWLTDSLSWYGNTMKQAIGASWNVGAQVAKAAGFNSIGDIAQSVAQLMISKGQVPAIKYY